MIIYQLQSFEIFDLSFCWKNVYDSYDPLAFFYSYMLYSLDSRLFSILEYLSIAFRLKGQLSKAYILCSHFLSEVWMSSDVVDIALLPCGTPWMLPWRHLAPNSSFPLVDDYLLLSVFLDESLFLKFNDFKKIHLGEIILVSICPEFVSLLSADSIFLYFRKVYSGMLLNVYFKLYMFSYSKIPRMHIWVYFFWFLNM